MMREFDALAGYPEPNARRLVNKYLRTIKQRIVATERGYDFFDGDRCYGYGGYRYDGRWIPIVENMCCTYELDSSSKVLQIGSEKGFLLHDFLIVRPGIQVTGVEASSYARKNTMKEVQSFVVDAPYVDLPFAEGTFDFVLALGPIYTLNLEDAIRCLKEIQRVGRGKSFVTLGSYMYEEDYWLFRHWTLLGTTILQPDEWKAVLEHVGYTGDYKFTGATSLHLQWDSELSK